MQNETIARMPVAWLRRVPEGYRTPLWRWILLPASAWMLRHYGGVWVSGELQLTESEVRFVQAQLMKSSRLPPQNWMLPLGSISDLRVVKGMASETLEFDHLGGTEKLMAARPAEFVALVRGALGTTSTAVES